MSALAHVFEQAGLATVGISLVRGQAERSRPPRMLHVNFPLGRPLGKPGDAVFQRRVLAAAFALLERSDVPVLVDFPDTIEDESEAPLACALPPRHDPSLPAAIDEIRGLRPAWDRRRAAAGVSALSGIVHPDELAARAQIVLDIANGADWQECGLSAAQIGEIAVSLRAYYEEVAIELAAHTPAARQSESWLYRQTELGHVLRRAQAALKAADAPRAAWFPFVPIGQPPA
ncbi:MAG: hypothetical protein ACKV2O_24220 [Acidimicrobiales bacterium]